MIDIVPNWHPAVVHFALALPLTATALHLLSAALGERPAARAALSAAHWNLGLGVLSLWLAVGTGMAAWLGVHFDDAGLETLRRHQWWAWGTASAYSAVAGWLVAQPAPRRASPALLAISLLAAACALTTGWLGGENVYRHGIGVERLPEP